MPSRRDIEVEIFSYNLSRCRALKPDGSAFQLARSFLEDFGFVPLARHLEETVEQKRVVFGPFPSFLATSVERDGCEWIILSDQYAEYLSDDQIAASLIHEIGALRHFAPLFLDHVENERRERLFLNVQHAKECISLLMVQWHRRGGTFSEQKIPIFLEDHGAGKAAAFIDSNLVHHLEFRHQTTNAIVILPDRQVVLLHRAAHRLVEDSTLSIVGGHLHAGSGFIDAILHQELPEELGMRPGYRMEGLLVAAVPPGNWRWNGQKNREYRALYVYFATKKEQERIREQKKKLEWTKKDMEEWRFDNWLADNERAKPGYYESQGIHFVRLEDLTGRGLRIDEVFADVERLDTFVGFSSDLLLPLVHDRDQMDNICSIIDRRAELHGMMSRIRGYFSRERYQAAAIFVDRADALVRSLLMHGTHPGNGLLRTLFRIGVYRKVMKAHRHLFLEGQSRNVLQVLLVLGDRDCQEVLLQRRGLYKRLFPGKLTVSASCHWPGDETRRSLSTSGLTMRRRFAKPRRNSDATRSRGGGKRRKTVAPRYSMNGSMGTGDTAPSGCRASSSIATTEPGIA
ncbi:MAG: hypothetical protein U1F76_22185 [Candidatus Competibacteraceae bacterium]